MGRAENGYVKLVGVMIGSSSEWDVVMCVEYLMLFFFFKQKTAYEI